MTLNLVTTCDLVAIFERPFFNLLHKIIRFSDIMQFSDNFCGRSKVSLNRDCTVILYRLPNNYFLGLIQIHNRND